MLDKRNMNNNFQRIGSKSNTQAGNDFEELANKALEKEFNCKFSCNYSVEIGLNRKKKHNFDLGNDNTLVECKSHKWTSGNLVPSAKLTVWNEAMYYFMLAPKEYKKIFFVLRDFNQKKNETLADYYIRIYFHLIPDDVEVWEYDENKSIVKKCNKRCSKSFLRSDSK